MNIVVQVLSEIFLIVAYPFSGIAVWLFPKRVFEGNGTGDVIVIVERWLTFNVRHLYWKYYLQKKGFRVYIRNFPFWKRDFTDSARALDAYLAERKLTNVTLVGISCGALTSLLYLEERGGWKRVRRFVSVGAPFHGTPMAAFLLFTRSGWELLPGSKFLKRLTHIPLTHPERMLTIRARWDEMVPSGSSLPGVADVTLPVVGHNNLHIRVRRTYQEIVRFAKG